MSVTEVEKRGVGPGCQRLGPSSSSSSRPARLGARCAAAARRGLATGGRGKRWRSPARLACGSGRETVKPSVSRLLISYWPLCSEVHKLL
uniref:Uncharacterized protein n=1 Tax=Oryza punctata TaxID=4537 RepID=A0A0E0L8F1_ORYPU